MPAVIDLRAVVSMLGRTSVWIVGASYRASDKVQKQSFYLEKVGQLETGMTQAFGLSASLNYNGWKWPDVVVDGHEPQLWPAVLCSSA